MKRSRVVLVAVLLAVIAGGGGFFLLQSLSPSVSCDNPLGGKTILKTNLAPVQFGGVTKFQLPSPLRNPNAVYVAPDDSVWFGEQTLPGVGHLFPNGTLIEHRWPFSYQAASKSGAECIPKTQIWGITVWNGRVWATDSSGNQLVGLDPATGEVRTAHLSGDSSFPYTVAISPSGNLWFTELYNGKIGSLDPSGTVHEYSLPGGQSSLPAEIVFQNSSYAYYVDVGLPGQATGNVYGFNPQSVQPVAVSAGKKLNLPTSLALGDGGLWVAIHGASDLSFYDRNAGMWTDYPTSRVPYVNTTLPYFVKATGSVVWFNEHFGDRLGRVDLRDGSLLEVSLSNPPAKDGAGISNTLTFGVGGSTVWFAQWTTNYVGYLGQDYKPPFAPAAGGGGTLTIAPGGTATAPVTVTGESSGTLSVQFSDSEAASAKPHLLSFQADAATIGPLQGSTTLQVTISASGTIAPGTYTGLVSVSDGAVVSSVYLRVEVSPPKQ